MTWSKPLGYSTAIFGESTLRSMKFTRNRKLTPSSAGPRRHRPKVRDRQCALVYGMPYANSTTAAPRCPTTAKKVVPSATGLTTCWLWRRPDGASETDGDPA